MADESDFDAVVADVQLHAQTDLDPVVDVLEVEAIVRQTARAQTWITETAYAYGAFVIPTVPNGRRYRVIAAGESGEDEPTWVTDDGGTFTDGTVTFEEAGPHSGSTYDTRKAIHRCLAVKLAKDQLVDFSADGRTIHGSQRAERIRSLMMSYTPLELA
jgi:hypothetical protein